MIKRIIAGLAVAAVATLGLAVPAQAKPLEGPCPGFAMCAVPIQTARLDHLPAGYCNSGSPNWTGWQWPPTGATWGAVNWCGMPWHGDYKLATWDNDGYGDCVTVWGSSTVGGSYSPIPGTTSCGNGVITISPWRNGIIKKMLIVKHTMAGNWITHWQFYYCGWDAPSC